MRIAVRLSVALALILPLLFLLGGGWLTTFAIAVVGFGTGRLVERLLLGPGPREHGASRSPWLLAVLPLLGLAVLAGVELVEYRLAQQQAEALAQMQQSRRAQPPAPAERVWEIEVLDDGSILSDGVRTPLETLTAPAHTGRAELRAHPGVPYDRVIQVMDQIRALGIEDIGLTSP